MKKSVKRLLYVVLIFALILLKCFFTYRPAISGIVVDSVTHKPIPDMKVERYIKLSIPSPGGEIGTKTHKSHVYTDKYGAFYSAGRIVWKRNLFLFFNEEWINVNLGFSDGKIYPINENFSMSGFVSGHGGFTRRTEPNHRAYYVELAPVVSDLDECNDNQLCIEENSFAQALKKKEWNLCFNVEASRIHKFQQGACFSVLGVLKNDESICSLDSYYWYLCERYIKDGNRKDICGLPMPENYKALCYESFQNNSTL